VESRTPGHDGHPLAFAPINCLEALTSERTCFVPGERPNSPILAVYRELASPAGPRGGSSRIHCKINLSRVPGHKAKQSLKFVPELGKNVSGRRHDLTSKGVPALVEEQPGWEVAAAGLFEADFLLSSNTPIRCPIQPTRQ
jgi:hypothetical protein